MEQNDPRIAPPPASLANRDRAGEPRSHIGAFSLILGALGLAALLGLFSLLGLPASPLTWYVARASGFTLYLLFWLSVVSGLGLTTSLLDSFGGRPSIWLSHRFATELAFSFLGLHMLSLAADTSVALGFRGVLLPFSSDVRQPWTDLGIITAGGMVVLAMSFGLRRFIGRIGWRLLHFGAFPLWLMGLAHGIGAGSDSDRPWAITLYLASAGVVVFLSLYRLLTARGRKPAHGALGRGRRPEPEYERVMQVER